MSITGHSRQRDCYKIIKVSNYKPKACYETGMGRIEEYTSDPAYVFVDC